MNSWHADPVIVVPYDPEWPNLFQAFAHDIRLALGEVALRIDHIGSTSVMGLAAKPVIDIQISVESLEPMSRYLGPLTDLGYVWIVDNPDVTKRYFREPPGQARTHVHVRKAGSLSEQLSLLFRDYLRVHPQTAQEYAQLKYKLARKFKNDREKYTESKSPFIWNTIRRASEWSQVAGWEPGSSDA